MVEKRASNRLNLYSIAMNRACSMKRYDKYLSKKYCVRDISVCIFCRYYLDVDDMGWPECYMQTLINRIDELRRKK
jgi:hypothetical protein